MKFAAEIILGLSLSGAASAGTAPFFVQGDGNSYWGYARGSDHAEESEASVQAKADSKCLHGARRVTAWKFEEQQAAPIDICDHPVDPALPPPTCSPFTDQFVFASANFVCR
ncbi:MAG: hypothetical protein ACXWP1_01775 [Bdellovibrionota bacterium]